MKKIIPILILFMFLIGCKKVDDIPKELSFLPISEEDVSIIKVWGRGVDGREATLEETQNILKWLKGVKHFEKEENIPSERKAPMSEIKIYLKTNQEVSIHRWGKNLEINWSYQFAQTDLEKFLDGLGIEVTFTPQNASVGHQGFIVDKKIVNNESYRVLLVSGIKADDFYYQSTEEIVNKAKKEMNAAWYVVDQETYGKLQRKQKVEITSGTEQMDSNPPIRDAKRVEIIETN